MSDEVRLLEDKVAILERERDGLKQNYEAERDRADRLERELDEARAELNRRKDLISGLAREKAALEESERQSMEAMALKNRIIHGLEDQLRTARQERNEAKDRINGFRRPWNEAKDEGAREEQEWIRRVHAQWHPGCACLAVAARARSEEPKQ